jgi:hypothetical protein
VVPADQGQVTQHDAATGQDLLLARTTGKRQSDSFEYIDGQNTVVTAGQPNRQQMILDNRQPCTGECYHAVYDAALIYLRDVVHGTTSTSTCNDGGSALVRLELSELACIRLRACRVLVPAVSREVTENHPTHPGNATPRRTQLPRSRHDRCPHRVSMTSNRPMRD